MALASEGVNIAHMRLQFLTEKLLLKSRTGILFRHAVTPSCHALIIMSSSMIRFSQADLARACTMLLGLSSSKENFLVSKINLSLNYPAPGIFL